MEERSDSMPSFSVWASMSLFSERKDDLVFWWVLHFTLYVVCYVWIHPLSLKAFIFRDLTNIPVKNCSQNLNKPEQLLMATTLKALQDSLAAWKLIINICNIINHNDIHDYHGSPWFSAKTVRRQSPASAELASATDQHHEMKSEATRKSPELQRLQ